MRKTEKLGQFKISIKFQNFLKFLNLKEFNKNYKILKMPENMQKIFKICKNFKRISNSRKFENIWIIKNWRNFNYARKIENLRNIEIAKKNENIEKFDIFIKFENFENV